MIDSEQLRAHLSKSKVLGELPETVIQSLSEACEVRKIQEGEVVVREGDVAEAWFVILDGNFSVTVSLGSSSIERELRRLGPGDQFGEIALLAQSKRTASVRATTAGSVASLSAKVFRDLLQRSSDLALALCETLGRHLSQISVIESSVPFKRIADYPESRTLRGMLPAGIARFCRAAVLHRSGAFLVVGMTNPYDSVRRGILVQYLNQFQIDFVTVAESDSEAYFDATSNPSVQQESQGLLETAVHGTDTWEQFGDTDADQFLDRILHEALETGSSDIHIEPKQDVLNVRIRCAGRMLNVPGSAPDLAPRVLARIRILAGLDLHHRWQPQDGTIHLRWQGEARLIRVAIVPALHGGKVAMRLLDAARTMPGELEVRFPARAVRAPMEQWISRTEGLILVGGPAGSGKTTTLYALLNYLHALHPSANIVTLEDPVDRELPFATQIAIHPASGRSFANILRALLRQDPDVIMVGEIRDSESAAVAVEAATTGHLVLASIHTGRALESLARLQSLGVPRSLVADALCGVVAQRLVPRVCPACAAPIPDPANDAATKAVIARRLVADASLLRRGRGCTDCDNTGRLGLLAMIETWTPTPASKRHIAEDHPSESWVSDLREPEFFPLAFHAKHLLESAQIEPESVPLC